MSDPGGVLATPCAVIDRSRRRGRATTGASWSWPRSARSSASWSGLPLSLDGSVGPAAAAALAEVERLGATTDLPVDTYDERFTTVTADRHLMERRMKADARRRVIDKAAAAVMLQAWLDGRRPSGPPSRQLSRLLDRAPVSDIDLDAAAAEPADWPSRRRRASRLPAARAQHACAACRAGRRASLAVVVVLVLALGGWWVRARSTRPARRARRSPWSSPTGSSTRRSALVLAGQGRRHQRRRCSSTT